MGSLHGLLLQPPRPGSPRLREALHGRIRGGEEARDQVDGVPDQEGRKGRLPGHRQTQQHGVGESCRGHGGCSRARENGQPESPGPAQVRTPRVTRTCATSWRPSISGSRWRGSRTSGTGSSRSSALETVWVCISWTRRLEVKYPLCVSSPHIGKLFNSRQNYLLSF